MGEEWAAFLEARHRKREESLPVRPTAKDHALLGCRGDSERQEEKGKEEEGLSQNGDEKERRETEPEKFTCVPCESLEKEGDTEEKRTGRGSGSPPVPGEEGDMEEEGEEGRTPIRAKTPCKVSRDERERHELTHTPFRPWCEFCVMGRGRNQDHQKKHDADKREEQETQVPRMSCDYFLSQQDEDAKINPMVVMIDDSFGVKYARVVEHKGTTGEIGASMDWLVMDMSSELKSWGHGGGPDGHIIIKSDGESSIKSVVAALARYHGGRVVPELSAKGESQSNGRAEEAGKTVRGFARILKFQLERNAGVSVDELGDVALWMVRWAAMLASRFLVGKDGKTSYERKRGRKCRIVVVPFRRNSHVQRAG